MKTRPEGEKKVNEYTFEGDPKMLSAVTITKAFMRRQKMGLA